jgi:hypothetical protein
MQNYQRGETVNAADHLSMRATGGGELTDQGVPWGGRGRSVLVTLGR